MTDLDIINFAKILLSLDIEINKNGSVVFYKDNQMCVYTKNQFIDIFL
jgi:hypothetical protein